MIKITKETIKETRQFIKLLEIIYILFLLFYCLFPIKEIKRKTPHYCDLCPPTLSQVIHFYHYPFDITGDGRITQADYKTVSYLCFWQTNRGFCKYPLISHYQTEREE